MPWPIFRGFHHLLPVVTEANSKKLTVGFDLMWFLYSQSITSFFGCKNGEIFDYCAAQLVILKAAAKPVFNSKWRKNDTWRMSISPKINSSPKLQLNILRYQHQEISNLYVHFETDYVRSAFLLLIPNDILSNDPSFADYFRVCCYAGYPVTRILSRKYERRRQTGDILAQIWPHQSPESTGFSSLGPDITQV